MLTWELVKAEIDARRPMVLMVDANGDVSPDHLVTVIGYREINGYPEYGCWDTWSTTVVRWQRFGVWRPVPPGAYGAASPSTLAPLPRSRHPNRRPRRHRPHTGTDPNARRRHHGTADHVSGADDAWHQSGVNLTLRHSTTNLAWRTPRLLVDGGAWSYRESLTVTLQRKKGVTSGVHTVAYRSADLAGNVESAQFVQVKLDGVPPKTSSNADGATHAGSFALELTPVDTLSGVATT